MNSLEKRLWNTFRANAPVKFELTVVASPLGMRCSVPMSQMSYISRLACSAKSRWLQRQIGEKQLQRWSGGFQNLVFSPTRMFYSVHFCSHASSSVCFYFVLLASRPSCTACAPCTARRIRDEVELKQTDRSSKYFEILKSTKITEIFEAVLHLFRTISRLWLFGILSQEFTISKNEQSRKTSLKHFQSKRSGKVWADSGSKLIRYALLGSYGPDVVNFKFSVQCEEPMAPCSQIWEKQLQR